MTDAGIQAPRHQLLVITAAVVAAVAGAVAPTPTIPTQFWIALPPVALFGLPHGGADPWLIRSLVASRDRPLWQWFGAYVALALAFVAIVLWQPLLALVAFLLLSVWHFGRSDAPFQGFGRRSAVIWLAGSIPVIGPMAGHPAQTGQLFAWLLDADAAATMAVVEIIGLPLLALWVVGLGGLWLQGSARHAGAGLVELLVVAAAMVVLAPVLAFTLYFCVVHSTRHFLELLASAEGVSGHQTSGSVLVRQAAPATLATIALSIAVWWFLGRGPDLPDRTADATRVLFWGLAALTVPHVVLVERWWAPARR